MLTGRDVEYRTREKRSKKHEARYIRRKTNKTVLRIFFDNKVDYYIWRRGKQWLS